ncbi:MAG: nuclear transport factor 2 family protein [Bacteroidota bacterium]
MTAPSRLPIEIEFRDSWTPQETENVTTVLGFVQRLMNDHDLDGVKSTYGDHPYVQHNRAIPDGIEALADYVGAFAKRFPEYSYDVKRVLCDGEFVTFHSHATVKHAHRGGDSKGFNIIDTWRIEDGRIADHWDAVQPLDGFMRFYVWLTGGAVRNPNGVF